MRSHLVTLVRPPAALLAKVRWAFLLASLLSALVFAAVLVTAAGPLALRIEAGGALVLLGLRWVRRYAVHGQEALLWTLGDGLLLAVVGLPVGTAPAVGVFYTSLYFVTLYGAAAGTGVTWLVYVLAFGAASIASPPSHAAVRVLILEHAIGFSLIAFFMAFVRTALYKHEQAVTRERVVRDAASALLAQHEPTRIYPIVVAAFQSLVAVVADARVFIAAGAPDALRVVAASQALPEETTAATFSLAALPEQARQHLLAGLPTELTATETARLPGGGWAPDLRRLVYPLLVQGQCRGVIATLTGKPCPSELRSGMAAVATQAALALETALLTAALRRSADDLRQSEERYRGLFEGVADAIVVIDAHGRYVDANAAAAQLFGCQREDLLHRRVDDRSPGGLLPVAAEALLTIRQRGTWEGESQIVRLDGTIVPVEARSRVVHLPDGIVHIAAVRDLTERKQADAERAARERAEGRVRQLQALAEARALYEAVAVNLADGLAIIGTDERVLFWNPQMEQLLDMPAAHAVGQPLADVWTALAGGAPGQVRTWPRAEQATRAATSGMLDAFDLRLEGERPRDLAVLVFPIGSAPTVHGYGWLVRDVTRERELERLKDELVSVVSHELRTPLGSLVGFSELLLTRDFPEAKRRQLLETMLQEGRRLAGLLDEFLDLQRIESGRLPVVVVPTPLPPLVERAVATAGDDPTRPIRLAVPATLPPVLADADRCLQVLGNLLSNARKYSPQGGAVTIAARLSDGMVEVTVADHGLGMPPDALPRLFQRFYRVDNSDRRQIKGTGLGLAICRKIVDVHGGRIWAESAGLGQGTTMHFTLPVAETGATCPDVLVVEDDPVFAQTMQEALRAHGYSSVRAASAETALAAQTRGQPRTLVLDMILPGRSGDSLLRTLRDRVPTLPIVIVTCRDAEEVRAQVQDIPQVAAVLQKGPGAVAAMVAAVQRTVGRAGGAVGEGPV